MAIKGVSLVGICVADLGRSIDFYCAGLGFELLRSFSIAGDPWTRVLEVEPLALESRILRRDGLTIELLLFSEPGHVGDGRRRPMNALGFTHLAVWVDDIDLEARRVASSTAAPSSRPRGRRSTRTSCEPVGSTAPTPTASASN